MTARRATPVISPARPAAAPQRRRIAVGASSGELQVRRRLRSRASCSPGWHAAAAFRPAARPSSAGETELRTDETVRVAPASNLTVGHDVDAARARARIAASVAASCASSRSRECAGRIGTGRHGPSSEVGTSCATSRSRSARAASVASALHCTSGARRWRGRERRAAARARAESPGNCAPASLTALSRSPPVASSAPTSRRSRGSERSKSAMTLRTRSSWRDST